MLIHVVRLGRTAGWMLILFLTCVIAFVLFRAAMTGPSPTLSRPGAPPPTAWEVLSLSDRDLRIIGKTLGIAAAAVIGSFLLAAPAALALAAARGRAARTLLYGLTVWPLLTPPSVIAYAWTLLATQQNWAGLALSALGWHRAGAAPLVSVWLQAAWLWPIPALILSSAVRAWGLPAYRMALLDARPVVALLRAGLPAVRGAGLAAAGIVFLLSIQDAAIPPIMLIQDTWSSDMLMEVTRAARFADSTSYLLWRSWPMIGPAALAAGAAWLGWGRGWSRSGAPAADETGTGGPRLRGWSTAAAAAAFGVSVFPVIVFVGEVTTAGRPVWELFQTGLTAQAREFAASLIVAALTGLCGAALALAVIDPVFPAPPGVQRARWRWTAACARVTPAAALALFLLLAVMPPVILGRALIDVFDRAWFVPERWHWSIYVDSPVAWTVGVAARFGFLPIGLVLAARRWLGDETAEQARVDRATEEEIMAHVRTRQLVRPIVAGALLTACMALAELQVSSLLAPPGWIGGSLAVALDQQIHFGRNAQVVAMSLLLTLPAMLGAMAVAWLVSGAAAGAAFKSPRSVR